MGVCLYPINVKTADPIWLKFCARPHMTPREVYGTVKFKKKLGKYRTFLCKSAKI